MKKSAVMMMVVLVTSIATAGLFTDSFGDFQDNKANGWGQTFTPAKGILGGDVPNPIPQTVYLVDWTFARTNTITGTTLPAAGESYLAVYSALTVADMNASTLVGVSSNWVEMLATPPTYPDSLMTWQFDNLALDRDTQYAMMFVQYEAADTLKIVTSAIRLRVGNLYTSGGWIRVGEVANNWDADFVATYIPEPATMVLLAIGGLLLRRRQA